MPKGPLHIRLQATARRMIEDGEAQIHVPPADVIPADKYAEQVAEWLRRERMTLTDQQFRDRFSAWIQ